MGATTMPSINLIDKITQDYPDIRFQNAYASRWSPQENTVYYDPSAPHELLHELGHAILGHNTYHQDIDLLKMERAAWIKALEIAPTYAVELSEDDIEQQLDTYRDWLYARSRCPACGSAGIQRANLKYSCVLCGASWHANEARQCGLKRYIKN